MRSLALIGCGKMGSALLRGWRAQGLVGRVTVVEPGSLPPALREDSHILHIQKPSDALREAQIVVLAVKPQVIGAVAAELKPFLNPQTVILSIMAGQSLKSLQTLLGEGRAIIRAMPNTPAAIGKGITAAIANAKSTADVQADCQALLAAAGPVVWLEDEAQMDAVTALSGSGPAYVFYLIEMMAASGVKLGLSPAIAMQLARQTVIGAAALAEAESDIAPSTLRENVTSPGGTTQAALARLMDGRFETVMCEALSAAAQRSHNLSST